VDRRARFAYWLFRITKSFVNSKSIAQSTAKHISYDSVLLLLTPSVGVDSWKWQVAILV